MSTASSSMKSVGCSDTSIDGLRLAVALTVLAKKPRDTSYSAFLFDLQRAFPASAVDSGNSEAENYWRSRALDMEKRADSVQALMDSERAELAALRITDKTRTEEPTDKRRKKTKAKAALTPGLEMPTPLPATLISSIRHMFVIARDTTLGNSPQVLIEHFEATMKHIHTSIIPLLTPGGPRLASHLSIMDARELLSTTIPRLLLTTAIAVVNAYELWSKKPVAQDSSSSSSLASAFPDTRSTSLHEYLDSLFQPVYTNVIGPMLHAIVPLTHAYLAPRLRASNSEATPEQLHPAILLPSLSALTSVLDTAGAAGTIHAGGLDTLQKSNTALNDCAALCATRQLLQLVSPTGGVEGSATLQDRSLATNRVGRLVRKEALHALCAALTMFLSRSPVARSPSAPSTLGATRKQLGDTLSGLARACLSAAPEEHNRPTTTILSEGEQDALLAVLEYAWIRGVWCDGATTALGEWE